MKHIKHIFFLALSVSFFLLGILFEKNILGFPYVSNDFLLLILPYLNALFGVMFVMSFGNLGKKTIIGGIQYVLKNFGYKNHIVASSQDIIQTLIFIGSILVIQNTLRLPTGYEDFFNKAGHVLIVIAVLLLISKIINHIFEGLSQKESDQSLHAHVFPIINKFILIFIWIIGIISLLSNLGYNVSALITGAGVGGLALALAAQKTVSNVFGAVSVIINRPFKIGDKIKISGNEGVVKDIGMIYLKIINADGHEVLIPNETIISATIENFNTKTSGKK